MGAAEAKLTELVALVSQLPTGWKFIVDYHQARMRGKRSLSCHWWAAPTYVVPQRFHFPLVGPEAIPQCYFFAI